MKKHDCGIELTSNLYCGRSRQEESYCGWSSPILLLKESSNSIEIWSKKQRYSNSLVHVMILTYVIRNPWEELQDVRVRREQYSLS
jgi:hypothetical protein